MLTFIRQPEDKSLCILPARSGTLSVTVISCVDPLCVKAHCTVMSLAWASIVIVGRFVTEHCRAMTFLMSGFLGSPLKNDAKVKVESGGLYMSQNICVLSLVEFIACNEKDVSRNIRFNVSRFMIYLRYLLVVSFALNLIYVPMLISLSMLH